MLSPNNALTSGLRDRGNCLRSEEGWNTCFLSTGDKRGSDLPKAARIVEPPQSTVPQSVHVTNGRLKGEQRPKWQQNRNIRLSHRIASACDLTCICLSPIDARSFSALQAAVCGQKADYAAFAVNHQSDELTFSSGYCIIALSLSVSFLLFFRVLSNCIHSAIHESVRQKTQSRRGASE